MAFNTTQYTDAVAITTSDTADNFFSSIYIGGGGNLVVVTEGGTTVTFTGVLIGTIIPIRVVKVKATSTTATNLVGFRPS